jgi:hypothetical protein
LSAQPADLAQAQRIIALSRIEHEPMVEQRFPAYASVVEYWEVGDLPLASPAVAVAKMTQAVQAWIDTLAQPSLTSALLIVLLLRLIRATSFTGGFTAG